MELGILCVFAATRTADREDLIAMQRGPYTSHRCRRPRTADDKSNVADNIRRAER